jgi:hypothetical protein
VDIREIQRLHEQFAHAPLTIEAPIGAPHSVGRLLPPPVYAGAGASRRWGINNGNALLIGGIVAGVLAAGAIGVSIGNWQHRRGADASTREDSPPTIAHVNSNAPDLGQPPVGLQAVEPASATQATAAAPRPEFTQPNELSPRGALAQPAAQLPMQAASAPRPQPAAAASLKNAPSESRKAEPGPVHTRPAPPASRAQHSNAATDIKLF